MLVEHHVKYKEIHGVDETVWITQSEHKTLHNRLRLEGKCSIPANKLHEISSAAHGRTTKRKEYMIRYRQSNERMKYYKEYFKQYEKQNMRKLNFYDNMCHNVQHHEQIWYNENTGSVGVFCGLVADHGKKLYYIDIPTTIKVV